MSFGHEDILMMLDWNNPKSVQDRGIQLALQCKDFSVFIQPTFPKYNKNVWENCARIISQKSDLELQPYISLLLEWVQDLTWPGAVLILERLKSCKGEIFIGPFLQTLRKAMNDKEKNADWLCNLSVYARRSDVCLALDDTQKNYLEKLYDCSWTDEK